MKFNKNINHIILIICLFGFAYYLSNSSIYDILKKYYNKYIRKYIENFAPITKNKILKNDKFDIMSYDGQKDFQYHSENLEDKNAENLYKFLWSLVKPNNLNYNLTTNYSMKYKVNEKDKKIILKFLNEKLNNKTHKINNLKIVEKNLHFFKNQAYFDLKPFQILGNYYLDNNFLGKIKLQIELTFRFDQPNDIFISQNKFNKSSGIFNFNRITLINYLDQKQCKNEPTSLDQGNSNKKNYPIPITNSDENNMFRFNYCTTENNNNLDTINSLIPDDISITDYEVDSDNVTSDNM